MGHMTPGGMARPASGTGWFVREGGITHIAVHKVASELHRWKGWREGAELSGTEAVLYMSRSPWTRGFRKVTGNCRGSR